MKRIKLLSVFIIIGTLVIGLTGCSKEEEYDYSVKKVTIEEISLIEKDAVLVFSGNLEGKKETVLSSKATGRIKEIKVGMGDTVKSQELLIALTGEENFSQRKTASDAYRNSLSSLQNTENLMSQRIKDAEINLRIAEDNLLLAMTNDRNSDSVSEEKYKDAKLQLEISELNYKNLNTTFEQKEKDISENIASAIIQTTILSKDIVAYLYSLNGISLPDNDSTFKISNDFIAKSQQTEIDTREKILKAKQTSFELQDFYNQNSSLLTSDRAVLLSATNISERSLNDLKYALLGMNSIIIDSTSNTGMSPQTIDIYRNQVLTYSYSVENMLLSQDGGVAVGLIGGRQAFENIKVEKENMLTQAEKQIELAKQKIELLESGITMTDDDLKAKIEILKTQVEQAKQRLKTAENFATSQTQLSKTQSDLALGSLGLANVSVSNTQVRAPYDSVVVEKYLEEGEIVNSGTPIIKVADISSLKLVIYVPEQDIKYFHKGFKATATTDSFVGEEFLAVVERISPKSEVSSKKVKVELKIVDPGYLKLGMLLNIKIMLGENNFQEVVMIPFDSVVSVNEVEYVWLVVGGKASKKEVEIGQHADGKVEIISGIKVDDLLILRGFDSLKNGEEIEVIK